jgi:PAS domain S-box-containing protein
MSEAEQHEPDSRMPIMDGAARSELECDRAWLAAIVDFCSDAILSKNLSGTITSWNAAAERMYGYPAAEVIGRSIEVLVPEDRLEELRGMDARLARGERVPPLETVRLTRDGRRIDVALTMSPIIDHTGAVVGASGIGHDISERRRAEEALRRSQAELEDFVENSVIGLHWVGPDGIILWANQAELDLLGYRRDEYLGRHIAEFHADPAVIEAILERLDRNEEVSNCEARLRCKDGSIRHALISSNVYSENGQFIHTRCFTSDITERKQAEIVIGGQKRALELIVEGAPLAAVLDALVHTIEQRSVHGALASILLLDDDGVHFRHGAAPSLPDSYKRAVDGLTVGIAAAACATPGQRRGAVIGTDIATDALWQKHRGLARRHGLRACWSAPILAKDNRILGAYAIYHRQPRAPDAADLQVIEVLSRTAAIAIEAKRAERQERLLVEELSHRVKNTLATAQSLATQTLRKTASPERFAAAFSGRLAALAKAHTLLAHDGWTGAGLHDLIREQLAAYCAADDASVTIQGDDVALEPSAALALGLTLHELATNAARHGALASPSGSIEIGAHLGRGSHGRRLKLTWRERGGPPIGAPPRRGFGLMLIERGLSYQLEGRVALDFRRAGLHCTIDLPVAAGGVRAGAGGGPGKGRLAGQPS